MLEEKNKRRKKQTKSSVHNHKAKNVAIMVFCYDAYFRFGSEWIEELCGLCCTITHSTHCTKLGEGVLIYYIKSPYVFVEICQNFLLIFFLKMRFKIFKFIF